VVWGESAKPRLRFEFAYRYSTDYNAIWWLRAEISKPLQRIMRPLPLAANLPEKEAQEEQIIIDAARVGWNEIETGLFIFDNGKNQRMCFIFFPGVNRTCIDLHHESSVGKFLVVRFLSRFGLVQNQWIFL